MNLGSFPPRVPSILGGVEDLLKSEAFRVNRGLGSLLLTLVRFTCGVKAKQTNRTHSQETVLTREEYSTQASNRRFQV